jgi:RNA polymerase sigma-70 factor (ECF subfamily)
VTQEIRSVVKREDDAGDASSLLRAARDDPAASAGAFAEAFAQLYDRHVHALYKYLLGTTGNKGDAEDLTSHTFLAALENLPRYQDQGNLRAWLFGIARNKWVDFCRQSKRRLSPGDTPPASTESDFLQEVIQDEKSQILAALVQELSESESELLRLRLGAELEFREIALVLGKSEAAVKKAYYRLIERMKKDMEAIYG